MRIFKNSIGFTMIELIITMAVLGVIVGVVIVIIDPIEQMARQRDNGRRSAILGLVAATQSYTANNGGLYPTVNPTLTPPPPWIDPIVNSKEALTAPSIINYSSGTTTCTTNTQNNYCYKTDGTNAIIFTKLESKLEKAKCTSPAVPYFLWASGDDKTGVVCNNGDPAIYSGYTYK